MPEFIAAKLKGGSPFSLQGAQKKTPMVSVKFFPFEMLKGRRKRKNQSKTFDFFSFSLCGWQISHWHIFRSAVKEYIPVSWASLHLNRKA
jgi:hypothetical protein